MKKSQKYLKHEAVTIKEIRQAIIDGRNEDAVAIAGILISRGIKAEQVIIDGITKAMEYLDKKCTLQEFCLLELMLAGRAGMDVIDYLCAEGIINDGTSLDNELYSGQKIILGSIKGDIHEIGKNIFSMVVRSYGYQVIDMGKDVDPDDLVIGAIEHKADFIAVSSLITTTIPHVREVRKYAADRGANTVKIIAGGAALKQSSAEYLHVDYVADTAFDGLRYIRNIISVPTFN
ncbi:MAG: cobalamin-dependent protein [Deltaproteobacteria bacterium]|nr:cobalamin-dependent protein [Deltaproteobacteria bacterium]